MGLFGSLFGGGDPAAKWARDPDLKLEVDLEAGTLCGVRLGLRPESLSGLGPPTNREPTRDGVYTWAPLGLAATATKGILNAYTVAFTLQDEGLEPYAGAMLIGGKPLQLPPDLQHAHLQRLLGEPWHRFADPEDAESPITWFYERRGLEWEVELLPAGTLTSITLHSPPTMAKPENRKLLRVEKPWPPA
jgi:hypothetical protein